MIITFIIGNSQSSNLTSFYFQIPNSVQRNPFACPNNFAGLDQTKPDIISNDEPIGLRVIGHILRELLKMIVKEFSVGCIQQISKASCGHKKLVWLNSLVHAD